MTAPAHPGRRGAGARVLAHRVAASAGVAALVAFAGLVGAGPASADPPRPTDYRSTIESIEPAPEGVEVRVVGGDSFLEVAVDEGHEVLVPGYEGEPYLRFLADGTVERNRNSPASYLNDSRQGDVEVPASAGKDAEPRWERVAGGGAYAWHDHAIHWMGDGAPPGKGPGDVIQDWTVDLTVDGTPTAVSGRLVWADPVSPLPWLALALLAAGAVVGAARLLGRRSAGDDDDDTRRAIAAGRGPGRGAAGLVGPVAALMAAVAATIVGAGQFGDAPPGSGVSSLVVAVPAAGVVAGALGVARRRRAPAVARGASLAAVATVLGWAALRLEVLWKPVISTVLPASADRAGTALALGLAVAAAGVTVLAAGLAAPPRVTRVDDAPDRTPA